MAGCDAGLDQRPSMSPMLLALITNMPASDFNHGRCKSLPWRLLADTIRLSSPIYLVILLDVTSFNGRDLVSRFIARPLVCIGAGLRDNHGV